MNWKYIKGGEKDFVGAPEWATECVWNDKGGESFCYWLSTKLKRVSFNGLVVEWDGEYGWRNYVKAQREPVTNLESALAASDGWIEWGGGECPVERGTLVDIKDRDGYVHLGVQALDDNDADDIFWKRGVVTGNSNEIIAYRLQQPTKSEQVRADAWRSYAGITEKDDEADLNECIGQDVDMPEWNGDGLPAVGCECEAIHRSSDAWQQIIVVAVNGGAVFGFWAAGGTPCALPIEVYQFRPLRTEAERKRDDAKKAISELRDRDGYKLAACMIDTIYDAISAGKIPGVKLEGK